METAKANAPVVKATDKPTSEPIAESVAPRACQGNAKASKTPTSTAHTARPTSDGDTSLIRALGLKIGRIVVDAGHGGHDTGTIGPSGLLEKDLTLDVALRLGKMLESRLGADVVYTSATTTLSFRSKLAPPSPISNRPICSSRSTRTPAAIANARGVETYYLNFTSSADALEVAARENAVSEKSIHELQDLVKKIAMKEKIEESREFASDVQKLLHCRAGGEGAGHPRPRSKKSTLHRADRRQHAQRPGRDFVPVATLATRRRLQTPDYRQKIAESLYKGIARYVSGLSGVKVAAKSNGTLGQQ